MGGFAGNSAARTEGTCFQAHPCLLWWMTAAISPGTGAPEVQVSLQGRYEAVDEQRECRLNSRFHTVLLKCVRERISLLELCNTFLNVVA